MARLTSAEDAALLRAHLTEIEVVGKLEKMRAYFAALDVDEIRIVKSKSCKLLAPRWQEDHQFSFGPSSTIGIMVFHKRTILKRVLGRYTGTVTQLIENDATLDLVDETGTKVAAIKVKLCLVSEPEQYFMKRVDADLAHFKDSGVLAGISGHVVSVAQTGDVAAQTLSPCIVPLGQALQLIVKFMDGIADAHPILKVSWTVLSFVYKVIQQQSVQDDFVCDLANSLRDMVDMANIRRDGLVLGGVNNVTQEIGRACLEVASLIHEYSKPSLLSGSSIVLSYW